MNVLFSSLGAVILTLIVAFMAGWKLTLVVLCFTPLLILSGYLQGRTQSKAGQSKTAKSFAEEGGRVSSSIFLRLLDHIEMIDIVCN
jgi:ABC-type bacteriocin/lantibiotic exporter with double-glycine peptidase domain